MADADTKRIKSDVLDQDRKSLDALKVIAGYKPANEDYTLALVKAGYDSQDSLKTLETQAEQAYKTARDNAVAAEWAFHQLVLGAKDQVSAQFGRDSNEFQSLGLKKKSERKAPVRKGKATE